MNKKIILLVMLLCTICANAQDDFGIWTSIGVEKKILPGLNAYAEGDFRLRDDAQTIDRWSGGIGLSYKIFSFLKISGDYNLIRFNHEKRDWETGHRFNLYATGSYKWDNFTISLRERFQQTYREGVSRTAKRANPKKILRSRLQVSYKIADTKFKPFASVELFHTLNDPQSNGLDKTRYTVGTEYKINKKNAFEVYYRYQANNKDDSEQNRHILGVGYTFDF
ncbi:DUF2490 domain-containing protein [Bacteroides sp. 214]|uniref:DUF2490 domain-containing protein n=1 Tax=Bacteroides sp. 214 TaxID=2302935 RepID=UPI0013D52790|nr:DUF2490 domain-containing protein [Bacteroides sp. 214]NDW12738.1 DUF2490 domain-containing protein [Bacteroides sp. 214]